MKSFWDDGEATRYGDDPLGKRVYTSRLLGRDSGLVLHGGGNTSVKTVAQDLFGNSIPVLRVKGSGWDLATIEREGFSPVRLDALKQMAEIPSLSDEEMVRAQRAAMTDPFAPNASVEAILHAIIPFDYVDHTHADAVVAVTNTPDGPEHIRRLYGDRVLVIPYVMPGFKLARLVYEMTRDIDWEDIEGMILLKHGIFTFSNDARESYERMIRLVTDAEDWIANAEIELETSSADASYNLKALAELRGLVSAARGEPVVALLDDSKVAQGYTSRKDIDRIATQGPLTPDHVIRTKRIPVIIGDVQKQSINQYVKEYGKYYERWKREGLSPLDPAPRWAVYRDQGVVAFGGSVKEAEIIKDIVQHTMVAQQWAEGLGGWCAVEDKDIFDVEYWDLEQAKLKTNKERPELQGRVALVTGAASGIGRAIVERLLDCGACVAALDIKPDVEAVFDGPDRMGIRCDMTDQIDVARSVESVIRRFGGLDVVVSNAGVFPPSKSIEETNEDVWQQSIDLNLNSHQTLLRLSIPFLEHGWDPSFIIIGSKNVAAPGPGASAYSVAKAGLAQLARVAALELGGKGIRVNTIHPNAVFDTGIWTEEVLNQRANHYGLTVDQYKSNNVLKREVTSRDVAAMVIAMVGPAFSKTTGAQVPVDGGNERVI
jgi:rhamnose utilization protein RhaD (predicted bifunctional aldolase and dehydrogenase)/NAD(P)-dependent dehydrogenase (short-subunit alcohol dehydrogenase family)